MRVLDRYIFTHVLVTCLAAVGFFTFIVTSANVFKELLVPLLNGQLPLDKALVLMGMLLPYAMTYGLPMGLLCGVLLVMGRLSAEHEIVAMRSAGISLWRMARPVYVLAILGMAAALFVNYEFMPRARVAYEAAKTDALRQNIYDLMQPRTFIRDFKNAVVFFNERRGNELREVWAWKLDGQKRVVQFAKADSATYTVDEEKGELLIQGENIVIETRRSSDGADPEDFSLPLQMAYGEHAAPPIPIDKLLNKRSMRWKPEWMTLQEWQREYARFDVEVAPEYEAGFAAQRMKLQIVLSEKASTAFAVLAFVLIAVPLGIKVSRRETTANLAIAVALALGHYFLTMVLKWLEDKPGLRPDLLLWLPNVIFIGLAIWLTVRAERAAA